LRQPFATAGSEMMAARFHMERPTAEFEATSAEPLSWREASLISNP
jgi:hypothetical protein